MKTSLTELFYSYLYFLGFFKKKFDFFFWRLLEVTNHLFFFVSFFLLSLEIWINKLTKFASHDHTPNLSTCAKRSVTVNRQSGSLRRVKYGIISILVTLNTLYCVIEDQQCSDWRLVALWTSPESQLCAYKTLTLHRRSTKMFLSSETMNRSL